MIAQQVGKNDISVDLITKALSIKPDYADAHSNFGHTLKASGKHDETVARYHKAIAKAKLLSCVKAPAGRLTGPLPIISV